MIKKIKSYRGAVQTWECDSNRHMNVMYYINKFELGGRNFGYEIGMSNAFLQKNNWGVVVVEQLLQYHKEVIEDDLLYIESSLQAMGSKTFTVFHEMKKVETDELVSSARIILVMLDKINRKAVKIPDELRAKMVTWLG